MNIKDETELTGNVLVQQRAYTVPLDVANELTSLREQARELAATLSNLYAEVMMNPEQSGTSRLARHHAEQVLDKYKGAA